MTHTLSTVSTWCDDDVVGFFDYVNSLVHVDFSVSANDLHGFPAGCGGGAVAAQDDIGQGTIHGLRREKDNDSGSGNCSESRCVSANVCVSTHHTHDVGEDGTRGANQSSNNRHEIVVE